MTRPFHGPLNAPTNYYAPSMRAFMYASPAGVEAGLLAQPFLDFAELYRRGFLDDDSTVWANLESPDGSFWALTERSQYVYLHRAAAPGYVRVTAGRMRWARVFDDTARNFAVDVDTAKIPGEADKSLTLIIAHRRPGQHVGIVADSVRAELGADGTYTRGNLTVIDLASYTPPERRTVHELDAAVAVAAGARHMMQHLDADTAALIRRHLSCYEFDLPAEYLQGINAHLDTVSRTAAGFADTIRQRLHHVTQQTA